MKSINFEILKDTWPELSGLGGFAEQYAYPDPVSALVKLRSFAEYMVLGVYRKLNLPKPYQPGLNDLLNEDVFRDEVPKVVLDKLHAIRIHGNKAAHSNDGSAKTALWLLKETYDLTRWLYVTFEAGQVGNCPAYQEPPQGGLLSESKAKIKREKKAVLEKLARQEAQMQELLCELEAKRKQSEISEKQVEELKTRIKETGRSTVDALHFDEATTRQRLIDSLLVDAGWDVAPNGGNTEEVSQEEKVKYQPTETGIGYADYVLWDDNGKPLAVIEAKNTSKNAEIGRKQAELYACGLEKMHGQKPVIFYTNGFDIWLWDEDYPPRKLFGFYSKDSLQYLFYQLKEKKSLKSIRHNPEIAGRLYQVEAIKQVTERFTGKYRSALIVQATGTGKTRVAISLTDVLMRANWGKRVLFLCDRRELRKQAKNAFNDFINEPITIVKSDTAKEARNKRIFLGTYPAMIRIFQKFDVGFFDLIIADESHRSIYNRYRELFQYFDCLQVGLTATPVGFINRNTYKLFSCEEGDPTANYPIDRAVEEGFLVPYEVYTHTTKFLRDGIKYKNLTKEQREQLENDGELPEAFEYESREIDKRIYNKETNRLILRNLMEKGIQSETGQRPGKSIIFARSHKHAVLLQELFNEMYPQYGGRFCQVIDTYDPRAEQLIDDLKNKDNELSIAISVDMLDTGIDIPEIVNLVFAKPVYSHVKFWQMIGRGTRLCEKLFGFGKDKDCFRIFDHWGNFERFDEKYKEAEPVNTKSLMQRVFEARIDLAETALNMAEFDVFALAVGLVEKDIKSLPEESISVREKWREKRTVSRPEVLKQFAPATVTALRNEMAPLMQWVNISDHTDAYNFDILISNMQMEFLRKTGRFDDFKDNMLNLISQLQMHMNPVRAKADIIKKVQGSVFWESVTVAELEEIRKELRGIIHYRVKNNTSPIPPKVIDITDGDIEFSQRPTNLNVNEMRAYKKRVEETLNELFESNPILQKIKAGEPVSEADLKKLTSLVLTQHPDLNLDVLKEFYSETAAPLDFIIRSIIGMDAKAVGERFAEFAHKYPLSANQTRFLNLLQNHISRYGSIEVERLYESPFTTLNSDGLDGVFTDDAQIGELISIINTFSPQ